MKIRQVFLLIVFTIILGTFSSPSYAETMTYAEKLNSLGLLDDIEEKSLEQQLSRKIGVTMILKSMGYTLEDANEKANECKFKDVNDWFRGWAALASELGITSGVSEYLFDPEAALSPKMFLAFQLRALGYDKADSWNKAENLASSAGILKIGMDINSNKFTKKDAADVMYLSLNTNIFGKEIKLVDDLIEKGIISEAKVKEIGARNVVSGLLPGEIIKLNNASQVKMSDNGKIAVWNDNFSVVWEGNTMYYISERTGEKFKDGSFIKSKFTILDLEGNKQYLVGADNAISMPGVISGDGNFLIWTQHTENGVSKTFIRNLKTGEDKPLDVGTDYKYSQLSYDGSKFYYHSNNTGENIGYDTDIYVLDLKTNKKTIITEESYDQYIEDLSHDGNIVAWTDYSDKFIKLHVTNMETKKVININGGKSYDMYGRFEGVLSSDGKILVYMAKQYGTDTILAQEVHGVNLVTGENFIVSDEGGYKNYLNLSDDGKIVVWLDNRNATFNNRDNLDIYGKNLETGEEFIIFSWPTEERSLKLSANGKVVYWISTNGSETRLYGKNLENNKQFNLGDKLLYWVSPDGKTLLIQDNHDFYLQNVENLMK